MGSLLNILNARSENLKLLKNVLATSSVQLAPVEALASILVFILNPNTRSYAAGNAFRDSTGAHMI